MKLIIRLNYVCVCNGWHLGARKKICVSRKKSHEKVDGKSMIN